jgi:nicotinate-nucleotide adenylyltransferase
MVARAINGNAAFELSRTEVDREGPSYTVETLEWMQERYKGNELVLILGQDALVDLPNWRGPERIVELAMLAVARRQAEAPTDAELERLLPGLAGRVTWIDMPEIGVSATGIREQVAAGGSIRYLVPESVREYIEQNRLYRRETAGGGAPRRVE